MAHNITPGKPRQSGIPTPGRPSGLPTPGRMRSTSAAGHHPALPADTDTMNRALSDAIRSNDPALHKVSDSSSLATAPRRSDSARPMSAASSAVGGTYPRTPGVARPRTPTASTRPRSRQSDVFQARSSSRADWSYDVGDNVRIESLGFEGILRFLGEIDDKPGIWAGVELSGGFVGKGKNDGTVNGKRYFTCAQKCGVFVATSKLSPPTVGVGALPRPPSSASTRSGRTTPSISLSNGRVTPVSSGRITPGFVTPSARYKAPRVSHTPSASAEASARAQSKITAGSRASKYLGMTAQQLSLRDTDPTDNPTSLPSVSPSKGLGSPIRIPSSPSKTPRALTNRPSNIGLASTATTPSKGRTSLATPRPRVPSAVAMPPPASPSTSSSRSVSGTKSFSRLSNHDDHENDLLSLQSIQSNNRTLQEKMATLIGSGRVTPASPSRSSSSVSNRFSDDPRQLESLQTLIGELGRDKELLAKELTHIQDRLSASTSRVDALQAEKTSSQVRVSELESSLKQTERTLREKDTKIEASERATQQITADLERVRQEGDMRAREFQSKLSDSEQLVQTLKEALDAKEGAESRNDSLLQAKNAEIALLESRIQKAYSELEEERRELTNLVDELRQAGQETIALYEERINDANTERYELEEKVSQLEEKTRKLEESSSTPHSSTHHQESAAEIDNETLREQVRHLQKKIGVLEDSLEDARASAEREEGQINERLKRYKEKEESLKRDLKESRSTLDSTHRAETQARGRVEELEEAMRESTITLENARAEIETLRSELANYEALSLGDSPDASNRLAESMSSRITQERTRMVEEITELREQLEALRLTKHQIAEELATVKSEAEESNNALTSLRTLIENLDAEKADLEELMEDRQTKLDTERTVSTELRQALEERTSELEAARKSINRDRPLNGGFSDTAAPPSSKDEITGLKHIVQELQKELTAGSQRNRLLESENKILLSETDQLREELKLLEEKIETRLLHEEEALNLEASQTGVNGDVGALQKSMKDLRSNHEVEMEQLRKRLADAEMRSTRTIHDLNKEISELESLVEAKIYREDELEREVEKLKEKASRSSRKSTKGSSEPPVNTVSRASMDLEDIDKAPPEEVCEICEQPGHDIFTCHLLKGDAPLLPASGLRTVTDESDPTQLFCDECESHGHVAAHCPHSMDVF